MALSKIDVANMVTGAVPVANGGTALTSGFVNGGATPAFFGQKASTQGSIARATFTKVTGMTNNEIDSDSAFDGTTFTVPSGGAGKYYIFAQCYCDYGTAAGSDTFRAGGFSPSSSVAPPFIEGGDMKRCGDSPVAGPCMVTRLRLITCRLIGLAQIRDPPDP